MPYRAIALAALLVSVVPFNLQAAFIDADQVYQTSKSKAKAKHKAKKYRGAKRQVASRARPQSALECMARNIYFEAGIEDRKGKIAVANVTMNRVKLAQYPSSVCAVVYQRGSSACAFSWTCDGKSNTPPNNEIYRESLQIARLALSGALKDVTGEADHYHADYVRPRWRDYDKLSARVGRHIFYKLLDG